MRDTSLLKSNLFGAGYIDSLPEAVHQYLEDQGYRGDLPDMLYYYLENLGYEGQLSRKLYLWDLDGMPLGGPFSPGDALLLETGDYLLLENGDKLLLE